MADSRTDHLAQDRVGATLNGKWRLDTVLGVGGMATVYQATHRNGHRVAVKILHPLLSAQDAPRERFLREGYIANKVEHRDAITVLDEDVDEGGNVFLVMELLDGEPVSVHRRATGGRLPASEVLWIANRLLDVLASAHANGVIHRDIKPENLFLTSDGNLKVLDFGIARFGVSGSGNTMHGFPMGTPGFAAPEQVRGEWDTVDARADLFAVGATMFTLVVGKLVHQQPTPYAQLKRIALEQAPRVRDVDPSVPTPMAKVIDCALSFRAQNRYQTAAEMRRAVAAAFVSLTGRPLPERFPAQPIASVRSAPSAVVPTVVSPGWIRNPSLPHPRASRFRLVAGAGIGIGIVALGLGSKLQRHSTRPPNTDSPPTARSTEIAAGARPPEQSASIAEERAPDFELPSVPSAETMPPLSPSSSAGRPQVSAPPADGVNRIRPNVPIEGSGQSSPAEPAPAASQEIRIPAAVDHPASPNPPSTGTDRMDFVETRH